MSNSGLFDEKGNIKVNPPRADGATEGLSRLVPEHGKPSRKAYDDAMWNPETSDVSLDDSAADNEQPIP